MENSALFLIQSSYNNLNKIWEQLAQMAQSDDHIVIMGDTCLAIPTTVFSSHAQLYCLENELGLLSIENREHIKVIDYAAFADLVLQFKRCITLK
ncbi:DsrH/TusB family sulfur metabolism protein [Acinetobacter courvalinii]|uniref:DsrH/TusB family sulfur relay protein n=1 Tax=Acinetobacter courvalinii TaxID=280147 RepID=A0AA42I5X9_9GAMM|nr:DsrH/TusB family sulfur metabolism protein [Acinetobacter courvalinii]MDH0563160.1 DsrH/TusB family sulfur relay protein [Acinetobacter courvalinii]